MPVTLSAPGVYVVEQTAPNTSIRGASTSVAAFVGSAAQGPTKTPTRVTSMGEFRRRFGGPVSDGRMAEAVAQFFANGGSEALVVRVLGANNGTAKATGETLLRVRVSDAARALPEFTALKLSLAHASSSSTGFTITATALDAKGDPIKYQDSAGVEQSYMVSATLAATNSSATPATRATKLGNMQAAATAAIVDKIALFSIEGEADATVGRPDALTDVEVREACWLQTEEPETWGLQAREPGAWANDLRVVVKHAGVSFFHLTVQRQRREVTPDGSARLDWEALESWYHCTLVPGLTPDPMKDPKDVRVTYLPDALAAGDSVLRIDEGASSTARPAAGTYQLVGGRDGDSVGLAELIPATDNGEGAHALRRGAAFNLLALPCDWTWSATATQNAAAIAAWKRAAELCADLGAVLLVDPPLRGWADAGAAETAVESHLGLSSSHAALYYPRIRVGDDDLPPSGVVAGVIARTDANRGIWKAPAGLDAVLYGIDGLAAQLNDADQGPLNALGVNVLRRFRIYGDVIWGARTLKADSDALRYLPVRRLLLYLEASLKAGTQWAVFEPNDQPLWDQLRLSAGRFLDELWRDGALAGATAREAYFVKCDAENNPPETRRRGVVNLHVGVAPVRPAEFIHITIQQLVQG